MHLLNRLFLVICVGFSAKLASADDNSIRVDVVVDLTDAAKAISRPSSAHPTYYFPIAKGYTTSGPTLAGEKSPPPVGQVEHMAAVALAQQGYLLARKKTPPTLLLIFWWGYKAPAMMNGDNDNSMSSGLIGQSGNSVMSGAEAAAMDGLLPTHSSVNAHEMQELVMGTNFDPSPFHLYANPRQDIAENATRYPRYYFMVSALDFKAATEKRKYVVYWTARVSTELAGHTLDEVLPSLIARGAPMFGTDTDGPRFAESAIVPNGEVAIGQPVLKRDSRQP